MAPLIRPTTSSAAKQPRISDPSIVTWLLYSTMHISIRGSETVEDTPGSPYTVYMIEIRGSRSVIRKRFSEFVDFHNGCLKIRSNGVVLPQLPPKKWRNNMEPTFVFNRGLDLEEYLRQFVLATKGRPEEQMLFEFLGVTKRPSTPRDSSITPTSP